MKPIPLMLCTLAHCVRKYLLRFIVDLSLPSTSMSSFPNRHISNRIYKRTLINRIYKSFNVDNAIDHNYKNHV